MIKMGELLNNILIKLQLCKKRHVIQKTCDIQKRDAIIEILIVYVKNAFLMDNRMKNEAESKNN